MDEKNNQKRPYVVGIAGGSASGKSTLTEMLEKELAGLRLVVLHTDWYFKPTDQMPFAKAHVTGNMHVDYNHPDSIDYSKLKDDFNKLTAETQIDVIIVEGLLVLHYDDIVDKLDLKLFVDCRPDERIVRRIKRNMAGGGTFDEITQVYLDMVRYRHDQYVEPSKWRADLIINGSFHSEKALSIIIDTIKNN